MFVFRIRVLHQSQIKTILPPLDAPLTTLQPSHTSLTPPHSPSAGSPRRSATASLVITVADDNDSPPVFERDRYAAVVNEDAPPRTAIMRLSTTDADATAAPVRFYITGGDPLAQFEVS